MTQAQQTEARRLAGVLRGKKELFIEPIANELEAAAAELERQATRIVELEQGKCLHQIAEPAAAPQSALVEALRAVCTDMVAVGNGQHAITDAARDKVEALQGVIFSAAPQAVQPAVQEGWQRVPIEPTREMLDAYVAADGRFHSGRTDWAVMLAAAPAHPAEEVPASTVANMPADPTEEMLEVLMAGEDRLRARHGDELPKERAKERYQALLALAATQPAAQGVDAKAMSGWLLARRSHLGSSRESAHWGKKCWDNYTMLSKYFAAQAKQGGA